MKNFKRNRCLSPLHQVVGAALLCGVAIQARAQSSYQASVLSDGPLVYYRLGDVTPPDVATNSGTLAAAGNGIYSPGVVHNAPGALAGNSDSAASYNGNGGAKHTYVPYNAAINPPAGSPFSIEFWADPSADTDDNAGPCPLFNRVSNGNRSGWVFFQRSPTTGWNFRMYNGAGSSVGADLTGGVNEAGTWSHVVATWDGTQARLYVNGNLAAGPTTPTGGYAASTSAIFSIGSYDDGVQNPFNGAMDEVAFYPTALSASKVLAHYQNGTNLAPASSYSSVVRGDGAVEYLRLDETGPTNDVAVNLGTLGAISDGTHFPGLTHQIPGAIVGDSDTAAGYTAIDSSSDDGGVPTIVPYNDTLNTNGSFTVEAWLKPTINGNGNAQCPLFNANLPENVGWDFYQRDAGTGWNWNVFNGSGSVFSITGGPYTVGQWCHLVAVYDATVPSATLYLNGAQVAQSTTPNGTYAPNPSYPFAIGGYWDGTENPFVGGIDEVAIYATALPSSKVLAHYQNGTNASRSTPYSTLILADAPVEYLRLDEPAKNIAANLGTLGAAANGTYVNATNGLAGPQPPADAGFESTNAATYFNALNDYIELVNPAGLNFTNQITLEAWVLPDANQNPLADIVAHGANESLTAENALRIENGNYEILSFDGSNNHEASFPVPNQDLGNGIWVHLAGTYDGTNWNLYRNGILVATTPDSVGALRVTNANWAIGARGRWKYAGGYPTSGQDRQFSGGIDEVAIYSHALSAKQIAAHYSAGYAGNRPLTISPSGTTGTLTWSIGTLQQSSTANGTYTDVPGATSPYTPPAGPTKMFYRLRF